VAKSGGGAQKPESIGVWKVHGGLKRSSLTEVNAYVRYLSLKRINGGVYGILIVAQMCSNLRFACCTV